MDLDAEMQVRRTALQMEPGEEEPQPGGWGWGGDAGGGRDLRCLPAPRHQPHLRKCVPGRGPGSPVLSMPWGPVAAEGEASGTDVSAEWSGCRDPRGSLSQSTGPPLEGGAGGGGEKGSLPS